jgi:hypothetical protein
MIVYFQTTDDLLWRTSVTYSNKYRYTQYHTKVYVTKRDNT